MSSKLTPPQKRVLSLLSDGVTTGHNQQTLLALEARRLIQINKKGPKLLKAGSQAAAALTFG